MNAVIQFPGTARPSLPAKNNKGDVMRNKKRGFAAMYRSLLDNDWTKDVYLLATWTRLVLCASSSERTVNYNGQDWELGRGQLVMIPGRLASELRDRNGKPMSRQAVIRILDWFESNGMIVRAGYDKGTVITICNYDQYQSLMTPVLPGHLPEHQPEHQPGHREASHGAALQGDAGHLPGHPPGHLPVPEEQPCITTMYNNQEQDQEISGDATANAVTAPASQKPKIPLEAVIHERAGKHLRWGTADDLTCAEWFIEKRLKAFEAKGIPNPKPPSVAGWANEIRLMRTVDGRTHAEMCHLFAWVCRTGRELEYCQSPAKLREKWDNLQLRKANAERGVTSYQKPLGAIAAAQLAAQSMEVSYDDNEPL